MIHRRCRTTLLFCLALCIAPNANAQRTSPQTPPPESTPAATESPAVDFVAVSPADGTDMGNAVAADAASNVYQVGVEVPPGRFVVAMLSPTGEPVWRKILPGSTRGAAYGVAVTGPDTFIAVGDAVLSTSDGEQRGAAIAKFNTDSELLWLRLIESTSTSSIRAVAIAPNGDIVIAGNTWREMEGLDGAAPDTSSDGFVGRLDPQGNTRWLKRVGGLGQDEVNALGIDRAGNIYIAGSLCTVPHGEGRFPKFTGFVARYSADGEEDWVDDALEDDCTNVEALAVAPNGDVFAGYGWTVWKLDTEGDPYWKKQVTPQTQFSRLIRIRALMADSRGGAYFAAEVMGPLADPLARAASDFDIAFGYLDREGRPEDLHQIGSGYADYTTGLATNGKDRVYVGGTVGHNVPRAQPDSPTRNNAAVIAYHVNNNALAFHTANSHPKPNPPPTALPATVAAANNGMPLWATLLIASSVAAFVGTAVVLLLISAARRKEREKQRKARRRADG